MCVYLAVLWQDHRLGVAELLLGIILGATGLAVSTAERHRAQGVRRGGSLHALHRGKGFHVSCEMVANKRKGES